MTQQLYFRDLSEIYLHVQDEGHRRIFTKYRLWGPKMRNQLNKGVPKGYEELLDLLTKGCPQLSTEPACTSSIKMLLHGS